MFSNCFYTLILIQVSRLSKVLNGAVICKWDKPYEKPGILKFIDILAALPIINVPTVVLIFIFLKKIKEKSKREKSEKLYTNARPSASKALST